MTVRKNIFSLRTAVALLTLCTMQFTFCQETETTEKKEEKPVKHTFEHTSLINIRTVETLRKNCLMFEIQHRFGRLDQGFKPNVNFDLLGMFSPANIRLGLSYGISDKLMIGIGGTKNGYMYDLNWRYKILQQTKSGSMPVSLTYNGNCNITTDVNFQTDSTTWGQFSNRLSYYHQLIIARKFSNNFSLQISPAVSHFNVTDTAMAHDNYSVSIGGKYNFTSSGSVIFEYIQPLTKFDLFETKPALSLGVEFSTGGHAFQMFVSTANNIMNQYVAVYNTNDFTKGQVMIGFNISRRFQF